MAHHTSFIHNFVFDRRLSGDAEGHMTYPTLGTPTKKESRTHILTSMQKSHGPAAPRGIS